MRLLALAALLLAFAPVSVARADDASAVQRALIERDQQSGAFARQLRQSQEALRVPPGDAAARQGLEARQRDERQSAENLEASQLRDAGRPRAADPTVARELRAYERERSASERRAAKPAPAAGPAAAPGAPLPLPGAPRRGVDPVTPDRFPD